MSTKRLHSIGPRAAALAAKRGDVILVDVREPLHLLDEEIPGALSVPLSGLERALTTWRPSVPVAFICRTGRLSAMAVTAARRAGLDACFVEGGSGAWCEAGLPLQAPVQAQPARLLSPVQAWAAAPTHVLIDLRDASEFQKRRIPGARCIPLDRLPEMVLELEDLSSPLIFVCGNGRRSRVAAELIGRRGRAEVSYVSGGLIAWVEAGLPIEQSA